MDMSPSRWITDWDFDEYDITDQYKVDTLDELTTQEMAGIQESLRQSFSPESNSSYPTLSGSSYGIDQVSQSSSERPSKQLKSNAPNDNYINLSSPNDDCNHQNIQQENLNESLKHKEKVRKDVSHSPKHATVPKTNQGKKRTKALQAQDHIIAERKRREQLSQRFIALSSLIPALKKTDKASVLADAIKYIKQLQENMKVLEEQAKKKPIESIVFIKKSQVTPDDESSSCDENFDGNSELELPEIEAKISEKDVLLRIHTKMQKGFLVNLLSEIEKLHLTVTNSNVLPFQSSLDITIIAQMDREFSMAGKDLVKNLQDVLAKYMNR